VVIVLLAAALVGTLAWQGIQALMHPAPKPLAIAPLPNTTYAAKTGITSDGAAAWEPDVAGALRSAQLQGASGNATAAEVEVDRAASIILSARMGNPRASAGFSAATIQALDGILKTQPDNARVLEHVTQARIEVAALRSAETLGPGISEKPHDQEGLTSLNVGPDAVAPHAVAVPGHVVIASPRALDPDTTLDRAKLGGDYLDATLMPETSEVLLPPATRSLDDKVRVEGLSIEGASQTLDGVRWKNVTFIGMRLRYEGGPLSLENVKFEGCRFGFATDERGARLADAIALGKTSIEIQ
jgi:hypothetical protein